MTGLALLGNIESHDPDLDKALQPVLDIMHEKYIDGVLIVRSMGAELCVGGSKHFFNKRLFEKYLTDPSFGMTNEFGVLLSRI